MNEGDTKKLWVDPDRPRREEDVDFPGDIPLPKRIVHPAIRFKEKPATPVICVAYTDGSSHILNSNYEEHEGRIFGAYGLRVYIGQGRECIYEEAEALEGWKTGKTEALGLYRALCWHKRYKPNTMLRIMCDSLYVVNAYNSYLVSWYFKDWEKSDGGVIEHKELWNKVWEIKKTDKHYLINVCHVPGHSSDLRNNAVHELAIGTMRVYRDKRINKV